MTRNTIWPHYWGSFFKRLKVADPMEKTWLMNPIISSMVYKKLSQLYLDIVSLFVGEEYERQLAGLPKTESEKIVLEDFPENLIDIMVSGLIVDVWIWPTVYDRDHHVIWEAERHEADEQNFRPHSVFQKLSMIYSVRHRVKGGDWAETTKKILSILGSSARSRVGRWTRVT